MEWTCFKNKSGENFKGSDHESGRKMHKRATEIKMGTTG
jgi:hypothetical protein